MIGFSLGEPARYQNLVYFARIGDFTWRMSGSEELVVVLAAALTVPNLAT